MIEVFPPGFGVGGVPITSGDPLGDAGIAVEMDVGEDGAHATATIDYGIVLDGSITLELEDGVKTELRTGDCLVQTGVTHTWRNEGDSPCTVAFVLIGATRR
jgi:quercetin dioxygenase-like cupin family protein